MLYHVTNKVEISTGRLVKRPVDPEHIGPYTILGVLGRGGMGTVYYARNDRDGQTVALKTLTDDDPPIMRVCARAQAIAKLHHPFIVPLLDTGTNHTGQAYYCMPIIEGLTPDVWVAQTALV